jgi:hypothetical protein
MDNIEIDHREMGWGGMDGLSGLGYGLVEDSCEHGNELPGSIKCYEVLG